MALRAGGFVCLWVPTTADAIAHIADATPDVQVREVAAGRVVAVMAGLFALLGVPTQGGAAVLAEYPTVRLAHLSVMPELSVPFWVPCAGPRVASIWTT